MISVYVWLPMVRKMRVGHAAMVVCEHTYISWWPGNTPKLPRDYSPIRNRDFQSDNDAEGGEHLDPIKLAGLNELAILQWWKSFGLVENNNLLHGPLPPYNLYTQNCSHIVATALKVGNGDKFSGNYNPRFSIWTPKEVLGYARAIEKGLTNKR